MDKEIKPLHDQAVLARAALNAGQMTYEDAFEVVKRYTDKATEKSKEIAKRFGKKAYPIDPRGFLR